MNYRLLFIISFLVLSIGVVGLVFVDGDDEPATDSSAQQVVYKDVVVMTATAERDVKQGRILQADDYRILSRTFRVREDEANVQHIPEMAFDISDILHADEERKGSLLGFLSKENVSTGSYFHPNMLISPKDKNYIASTLDLNTQVAYVIPVDEKNEFLLTTLEAGMNVSLFVQSGNHQGDQSDYGEKNDTKNGLIKVVDFVPVLRVSTAKKGEASVSAGVGSITVRLNVEELKRIYSLPPRRNRLIILPVLDAQPTDSQGLFVNQLKG